MKTATFHKVEKFNRVRPQADPLANVGYGYININPAAVALVGNGQEKTVQLLVGEDSRSFLIAPGEEFKVMWLPNHKAALIYSKAATRSLQKGRYYWYESRGKAPMFVKEGL